MSLLVTTVANPLDLPEPASLEDTGLPPDLVSQLLLKMLHFAGELSGLELSRRTGLPFAVLEPLLDGLKRQRHCEVAGGLAVGGASYRYRITDSGRTRAALLLEQNQYVGTAPVPLVQYRRYMDAFKKAVPLEATRDRVKEAFSHIVVRDSLIDQIGPALNGGHSMFIYGPPGNGKTTVAQAVRRLLRSDIMIPSALEVEGQFVKVFDPVNHEIVPVEDRSEGLVTGPRLDQRWIRCRRPIVMVGGELTLDALELRYNPTAGFYRAPVQLIANGGILVIDDFGRQHCSPKDLLNRWIVPLESRIDFLTLQTGQIFEVPFNVLLIFATNLKPGDLVDEAFLRRIQYKVKAEGPTVDDFITIFQNYCRTREVAFEREVVEDMLETYYRPHNIELRACHPRDLINQALALANYLGQPRHVTRDLLQAACRTYFVVEK
jgi:predicted ATPase with chaperone activity